MRIQSEGLLQSFKIEVDSEGQILLSTLSLFQIHMNPVVQGTQDRGRGGRQRLTIDILLNFEKTN